MLSDRPHAMTNYQLQGTDGCYESARARTASTTASGCARRCKDPQAWMRPGRRSRSEFLPDVWQQGLEAAAKQAGHGGGDYFEVLDFVDAIPGKRPPAIGIHEAMDMTLPGLVSQISTREGGGGWTCPTRGSGRPTISPGVRSFACFATPPVLLRK